MSKPMITVQRHILEQERKHPHATGELVMHVIVLNHGSWIGDLCSLALPTKAQAHGLSYSATERKNKKPQRCWGYWAAV